MFAEEQDDLGDIQKLVRKQNRKNKKSGGFQVMGLSHFVFKGVMHKGYKVPTPIQRKAIPLLLDGKDVVAMARTGSGKTAAFLVPMFERLKSHSPTGARALVLAPTRELALQTLKFAKELGKYTGLKAAVVLGGDRIDDQFAALHENPDIIIATPGRLMHVLTEMDARLSAVEYLVFDEADRLFEMGFQEQMLEIIKRLPESRQTSLFSATLPKVLVEFAQAGLHDPTLIRLDVENKLSDQLQMAFLYCRSGDKLAVLLHLLRHVIKKKEQTVIFAATKHHVEYLNMVLTEAGYHCGYSYSSLDPAARKLHVANFRSKNTMILIVTDLAARGIDIPMLNNVINYHFPAKAKLFVHRVGRVARAGMSGTAYSLVTPPEMAYVIDLYMFLGTDIKLVPKCGPVQAGHWVGCVPQTVIDEEESQLRQYHNNTDIEAMIKVTENAYKQYIKSSPAPSGESVSRCKALDFSLVGFHPIFNSLLGKEEKTQHSFLAQLKTYRPPTLDLTRQPLRCNSMQLIRDEENYISYKPKDFKTEKELSVGGSFSALAKIYSLDLLGDEAYISQKMKSSMKWDRKKKKFVHNSTPSTKKIKTESGQWISASYKTNIYKDWLEKSKVKEQSDSEGSEQGESGETKGSEYEQAGNKKRLQVMGTTVHRKMHHKGNNNEPPASKKKFQAKTTRKELKTIEQILKQRRFQAKRKRKELQKKRQKVN